MDPIKFNDMRSERDSMTRSQRHTASSDVFDAEATEVEEPFLDLGRLIHVDAERRERERILGPDATGSGSSSYKMLRTQVLRKLRELNANTLAVLSAHSGEGKTLTAINLAIAIAAHREHTALLVDLDLRNPQVMARLGAIAEVGIEDCLDKRRSLGDAILGVADYDRLSVLPARLPVSNSSELIETQRMTELMLELRTRYSNRILIFDLPPVMEADDALAFSRHVQSGLFVVAEGRTPREALRRSMSLLRNMPIVGTVLNESAEAQGDYYY